MSLKKKIEKLREKLSLAKEAAKRERIILDKVKQNLEDLKEAQGIAQEAAKIVQEKIVDLFSGIVNRCLRAVFDDPLSFNLILEKKRGKTEARPAFFDGSNEIPRQFVAGGVKDVASFALRLANLSISRPKKRQLLILDEPMKHLNGDLEQERFAELLMELSKELEVQIILVTDDEFLKIGKVVNF